MERHFCDAKNCGKQLGPDGFRARIRKNPGHPRKALDLCAEHGLAMLESVFGRPDADRGNIATPPPKLPRTPRTRPGEARP